MGNREEDTVELLNIDQEDDNLIGISRANADLCITGVSPLSPSMMHKALKYAGTDDLENCYGKLAVVGVPSVVDADLDLNVAPMPCWSPSIPNSGSKILSVLNFNEINKRSANRDAAEESKARKSFGIRDSMQLDGIAETSPVKNPGPFTSQLSRSYLDIENNQARVTPRKGGGDPTVLRKSRSRRSTTLRKSLAWDKAFFTDEGVLDNDELFAVASDTPKTLAMPELATIWDGPQNLVTSFEAATASANTKLKSELRSALKPEVRSEVRPEARPEVSAAVAPKPHQVRQIHITGSHAFSNAYSRASVIPQGSTSIPLPGSLARTTKQPGISVTHPTDLSHATGPDIKESRNTTAGLHHQVRIAALKKTHEAPPQKGPRVRLPNSTSNKKLEDKNFEKIHKVKQFKKVEMKPSEEVPKMHVSREKQPKMLEDKHSEDLYKTSTTRQIHPTLTRSMSTSSLHESPSALSRKVSSMSKRVKETLGKVMSGRAREVSSDSSLSHVHPVEKGSLLPKRIGGLSTVREVKDPNHRPRSNAAMSVTINVNKETVRNKLCGKGPPSCLKGASKQGPFLTRSKSAIPVSGLTRATDPGLARVNFPPAPSTPSVFPATPPHIQAAEPAGKPTGLRKPSPKLGFFDAGRASSALQKAFAFSQPLSCMQNNQPLRSVSEVSGPIEVPGSGSRGLSRAITFLAIPTAPHLRQGVASAPTSPRSIHFMHPSFPKDKSSSSPRSFSPTIKSVNPISFLGLLRAEQFAESHQLLAKQKLIGNQRGTVGTAPEASDSLKLPISLSDCTAVMEPIKLGHGEVERSFAESNLSIAPAVNGGSPVHCDSNLESGGVEPDDIALLRSPREAMSFGDKFADSASQHLQTSCSQPGEDYALEHIHVSKTIPPSTEDTTEDLREKVVLSEAMESSAASEDPTSASLGQSPNLSSSNGRKHHELTDQAATTCFSPRSSSFREISATTVCSCLDNSKPVLDTDISPSTCSTTPTRKERSYASNSKILRQFESPRRKSFRETPLRPKTASASPALASKHVHTFSQRLPWQSPSGKVVGDVSPGVCSSTPASGGKSHSFVSPSHAPDSAGTFEVLTPSSAKNDCVHNPGSSSKKVIRKIVEFESPSSQWSNWPVLGAVISADQLPVCGTKALSSSPRRPSGELVTEQSPGMPAKCLSNTLNTTMLEASHAELDRAASEHCTVDTEQLTDLRLSFSVGFGSNGCSKPMKFSEAERRSNDRNSSVELNGVEVYTSAKKERRSSMFSFARKAVARLTLSPTLTESSGQDYEGTPKPSIKTSRRFSRSDSTVPVTEVNPPNMFSEARICELEAAGPEILQKKNGPVTNSPPDKVVPDSNPWSPVRKNGQSLGPFDCTKLTYLSRGLVNS